MSSRVNNRRALVMADQGLSSLSNVVVSIFVARSLSADGFGAFGVAIVSYLLVQGVTRALVGEPLLSRYSSADSETRRRLVPDLVGAAVVTSVAGCVVVALAAIAAGGAAGSAMLALVPVLPLVIVQDTWRYAFIVDSPGRALFVDLVWLATVCALLPAAPADAGPAWFVMAWGLGAGVGAVAGLVVGRHMVGVPHPMRWFTITRDMGSRFMGEFATVQAGGQLVLLGVGALSGLSVLGAVRAAQVFYGPLNTAHQGIYLTVVPEGAQMKEAAALRRLMVVATLVLVALASLWMCAGLALPDSWGAALFGATWAETGDLMLPMGLAMVAGSAATGGFAGVRALGAAKESLNARLRTVPPQLILPLAGAALGAGGGYAVGFGLGHGASAVIWWKTFVQALGTRGAREDGDRDGEQTVASVT